jgi:hypothetical protein
MQISRTYGLEEEKKKVIRDKYEIPNKLVLLLNDHLDFNFRQAPII